MVVKGEEIGFGIIQLDNISLGEIRAGSMGLCYGPPGCGKSSMLAQFLFQGAGRGNNVCLMTNEPPARTSSFLNGFKGCNSSWLKDGYITVLSLKNMTGLIGVDFEDCSGEDLDLLLDLMVQSLEHLDARRLVIDPFNPLLMLLNKNEKVFFMHRLKGHLARMGVAAFFCFDIEEEACSSGSACLELGLFDIIVKFAREKEPPTTMNTLTIERWKGAPHARNTYVIDVSEQGIVLVPRIKPLEVR
ncbi:MAG: RAD55 family ATPase [Thermoplasmatota archaeon]